MVLEWELAGGLSAGVMPGLFVDRNEAGKRHVGGIFAAVIGKSLTKDLRAFVEVAGRQLAAKKNGGQVVTLDAGLAYALTPSAQLDAALARGLNDRSPDLEMTLGLSVKF